ncbi:GyrI-like domain-containing protein [Arenibacter sp. ARW7G5Y1]|uniref:GyrI-like domain-containing protein n=1 Tax=Arenibacter sp. ARW7G5Y1 TaxID=2135619 RepID=UPI000D77277A|nr:GyrI-like domain-containing protein [Arenibacter sp. ARW7G5Y1]PXX27713.1 AraC family transcriptional regulator [Arenibacter sp. ARW7G5Y1]
MEPRIEVVSEKKLIGQRLVMSMARDRTRELWQGFMKRRKEIGNLIGAHLISMQIYDRQLSFPEFNDSIPFEKWAVVEVEDFEFLPQGLESYTLLGGLYAVFIHKGLPSDFPRTAQYIFGEWLPKSDYQLDHREHFEIMGDKYSNNNSNSEEEVWVPIKRKIKE